MPEATDRIVIERPVTERNVAIRFRTIAVAAAVATAFVVDSFAVSPIPGVNEPHYLCKAKHFWQPAWCPGDLFLESSNPHFVFYVLIGWLTIWLPLSTVAVIGRLVALTWLAIGWTQLVGRATGSVIKALPAAGAFLVLQGVGDFSGEWVIGGVESKVFSYAALFQAIAWSIEGRNRLAATSFGLAVSFHPVTGLWGVLAMAMVAIANRLMRRSEIPPWSQLLVPAFCFSIAALPGLVPAVLLLLEPVSARTAFAGDYLQVFFRLPHHLDPMEFPASAYWWYAVLLVGWAGLATINRDTRGQTRLFTGLVVASLGIAVIGFVAGVGPRPPVEMPGYEWRMKILKFYPFRLFDVLLPMAVAVEAVRAFRFTGTEPTADRVAPPRRAWQLAGLFLLIGLGLGIAANDRARNPSRLPPQVHQEWLTVCRWIREQTPADSVFATPRLSWAFKWYAQRPEYVTFKDAPQDAAGLVEWNRRLKAVAAWAAESYDDQLYSAEELRDLAESEGVDYLIARRLGPMEIPPVFETPTFRVYRLR